MTTPLDVGTRFIFVTKRPHTKSKYTHGVRRQKHKNTCRDDALFFFREKNLLARLSLSTTAEVVSDSSLDLTAKDTFVQCRKGAQTLLA